MTHLFIINPAAGSHDRTQEYRRAIDAACQSHDLTYRIAVSSAPGDCYRITREAAESGKEYRVYACGGDGTLNEVAAAAAGCENLAVTHYAGGSGNDFVKIFSDTAPFRDLEQLLDCKEACFDMIDCNGDLALNICSVGLDARIGTDVANYKRLPFLHGFRAYALSTVVNIIKGISEHYVVKINGETIDARQTFVCVCNGRFYGGGFNPVPDADPCDGKLEVLLVKHLSRWVIPGVIGKFKSGRYKELPHLIRHMQADTLEIICDGPTGINLDGELRTAQAVTMKVSDKKLRFFYPKQLHFAPKIPAHT